MKTECGKEQQIDATLPDPNTELGQGTQTQALIESLSSHFKILCARKYPPSCPSRGLFFRVGRKDKHSSDPQS